MQLLLSESSFDRSVRCHRDFRDDVGALSCLSQRRRRHPGWFSTGPVSDDTSLMFAPNPAITDGSSPNTGSTIQAYASAVISQYQEAERGVRIVPETAECATTPASRA